MQKNRLALTLLVVLIWGFNFIVIKLGIDAMPPFLLGFVRFFLTSIPAVFFIKRPATPFMYVILYGFIMFAMQFALLFLGMKSGLTPALTSLTVQIQVFFTLLLAFIFLKEKIKPWELLSSFIAFGGIALAAVYTAGSENIHGLELVIGAAFAWGCGNIISKKIGQVDMISLVVWGSLIAWPILLILSLFIDGVDTFMITFTHLTWTGIGCILYIAYLSTFFAFVVWSFLLSRYPIGAIAPFTLLIPILAIFFSVWLLGEPLEVWKIIAATLVIGGLCINFIGQFLFTKKKS